MNIVLFINSHVPVVKYGGTQRVVYSLAQELIKLKHNVTLLIKSTTPSNPIKSIIYNPNLPFEQQLPENTDIVHLHGTIDEKLTIPYIITMHGNLKEQTPLDKNTVFVSQNHAQRYGASSYVLNGLNWNNYTKVDLNKPRKYYHFLGKAAWRIKNVKGAIQIAKRANENIKILGGVRFNFKMGLRFTFSSKASFYGMVGAEKKNHLLNGSKGLIFPILWHEPFGLAITESLYYGAPIFGTPYGSLQELVTSEIGYLSNNQNNLIEAIKDNHFDPKICHEYANDLFNSKIMAQEYIKKYEQVLNGKVLNKTNPLLQKLPSSKYLEFNK